MKPFFVAIAKFSFTLAFLFGWEKFTYWMWPDKAEALGFHYDFTSVVAGIVIYTMLPGE